MYRFRSFTLALMSVALVGVTAAGCKKASPTSPSGTTPPNTMSVSPRGLAIEGQVTLSVGQQMALSAYLTQADGSRLDITEQSLWSSSNDAIASVLLVSGSGATVTGVAAGDAVISAVYNSIVSTIRVTVTGAAGGSGTGDGGTGGTGGGDNGGGGNGGGGNGGGGNGGGGNGGGGNGGGGGGGTTTPTVVGITIGGGVGPLNIGASLNLTANASMSDGTSKLITAEATWSSSAPALATVNAGVVTGLAVGSVTVTVNYGGQSATRLLVIQLGGGGGNPNPPAAPTVVGLNITGNLNILTGQQTTLRAIATLSDNTTVDVTAQANWSSGSPLLASVNAGVVSGLLGGLCGINATYGGITASVNVTITLPVILNSITIEGDAVVKLLQNVQLQAIAHFSDGHTENVTSQCSWGSSNSLLGQLLGSGLFRALGLGNIIVTASFSGKSDTHGLQINLL